MTQIFWTGFGLCWLAGGVMNVLSMVYMGYRNDPLLFLAAFLTGPAVGLTVLWED